jgi:hypothetical protein
VAAPDAACELEQEYMLEQGHMLAWVCSVGQAPGHKKAEFVGWRLPEGSAIARRRSRCIAFHSRSLLNGAGP